MVDEHAGELLADRAVDERRGHAGVDAAGQAQDHFVAPDLRADPRDGLLDVVAHHPVRPGLGDVEHESGFSSSRPWTVCVTSGWNCTP